MPREKDALIRIDQTTAATWMHEWNPEGQSAMDALRKDARQHGMFWVLWRLEQDVDAALLLH